MLKLAFYLFGPPRLEINGEPRHISRRKAMALLAYLGVTAQPHSREALAALLWPENDPSRARASLRRTLSSLNRALGNGWVKADREYVCLEVENNPSTPRTIWLDVEKFRKVLETCDAYDHRGAEICVDCLPALEKAVTLYGDDFMAGFNLEDCRDYEEWQFFQREELRGQLTGALVKLTSHYAANQEYEIAIQHARRRLSLDPLHEPAHQRLMTLYDKSGQRAAALRQYQTCRDRLREELGVEPSRETEDLYQQVKISTLVSLPRSQPRNNLPVQATPFIGREMEVAEVRKKILDPDCHLLTLLGPGGSGKTRLAIEAAEGLVEDFKHGVFFVNLAPLEDPKNIPATIARAIHFPFSERGTPQEQLLDYLREKEMLLVLDNFEHLLDGVDLVNKIHQLGPGLKLLVTSRTRLLVRGEFSKEVLGMAYPDSPVMEMVASQNYSAIKLFESEARRVDGDFELTTGNLPDVIRVCSLLEGMPLGIVLAASWMRMLNPAEIGQEITRDLAFLDTNLRDVPRRQRSLQSVFNQTWRLLSKVERDILMALSVFRGGFSRDAAKVIAGASLVDLVSLLDKSILHRAAKDRFEIHETLRMYGIEKLGMDSKSEAEIRGAHSDYYLRALVVWERKLEGPRQGIVRSEMVVDRENIRTAWSWALDHDQFKQLLFALNGLCMFLTDNLQWSEGVEVCNTIVEKLKGIAVSDHRMMNAHGDGMEIDHLKLLTRALGWESSFNGFLGDVDRAYDLHLECMAMLDGSDRFYQETLFERAHALRVLPWLNKINKREEIIQVSRQVADLYELIGESGWQGTALHALGGFTKAVSRSESIKIYKESLAIRRKLGDLSGIMSTLEELSWMAAYWLEFKQSEELLKEALNIAVELDDRHTIVEIYATMGVQMVWAGRFHEARALLQEILRTYTDLEYSHSFAANIHCRACFPDLYLGEYQAARGLAQVALDFYETAEQYWGEFFSAVVMEIMGCIVLGEESFEEAARWSRESLLIYQIIDPIDKISKVLACKGIALRGLKEISKAKSDLHSALQMAVDAELLFPLTHIFPGIALIFLDQGEIERAVELYALSSTQTIVANSKWFADIAGDEIAAAAEALPDDLAEAARERGRTMELWDTAVALLEELGEMGWQNAAVSEIVE